MVSESPHSAARVPTRIGDKVNVLFHKLSPVLFTTAVEQADADECLGELEDVVPRADFT